MGLKTTPVSQCLEKKLLIFGFEVADVLFIVLNLSILNFIFGATRLKPFLVWVPTLALAIALRLGKRGKPDNYLIHLIRFQLKPRALSAFEVATSWIEPPRSTRKKTSLSV